jgi:hypothetical protein
VSKKKAQKQDKADKARQEYLELEGFNDKSIPKNINIQGRKAEAFKPFAEVLGVSPESVMSAQSGDDGRSWTVLYTLEPIADPKQMLYKAELWRDNEGVLQVVRNDELCSAGRFIAQVRLIQEGITLPVDEFIDRAADDIDRRAGDDS